MEICKSLQDFIASNGINIKDIAKAGGFNVSSIKTALYNDSFSFEKFCKIAIIAGFDLRSPENFSALKVRYDVDPIDMVKRINTYKEVLKDKVIKVEKEVGIEDVLHEAEVDTSFAVVCKMQAAAAKAEQKKIPVPEDLDKEVEAVVENENKVVENVEVPEPVAEIECMCAIKHMIEDMKGIEAFYVGSAVERLYQFKDNKSIEALKEARKSLDKLISNLES